MACAAGPDVSESGLVLALDGANYKSFKGEVTTNELLDITWIGDGGGTGTLVTDNNLRYNGYPTYYYTPGTSLNSYLNGADVDAARTSTVWTFSCYVKREDGAPITSLNVYMYYPNSDGFAAGTIQDAGNGWYRVSRTRTGTSSNIALCGFVGFVSGVKYYLSGAQLEKKSYTTTYVSTNTTRGTTVATGGGWADLIGNGNNGELVNGVRESSANGGSLVFDGTDDYVNAPLTKSATCTFSCWARTTTLSAAGPMLFNAGPNGVGPDLFFASGSIYWNVWDGGGNPFATTPASVTDGNYHYYVVVNDASSNTKLYYDGVLLGTAAYRTAANNTNLTIGGTTDTYMWNGNISNFSIYNRALSAAEISQNFNATRGRFGI